MMSFDAEDAVLGSRSLSDSELREWAHDIAALVDGGELHKAVARLRLGMGSPLATQGQRDVVLAVALRNYRALVDGGERNLAVELLNAVVAHEAAFGDPDPTLRMTMVWVRAESLAKERDPSALEALTAFVDQYGGSSTAAADQTVADALRWIAHLAEEAGDVRRAAEALKDVAMRFGSDPSPGLRWRVADAISRRARISAESGEHRCAAAHFEAVANEYGKDSYEGVRGEVILARLGLGGMRVELGDYDLALSTFSDLVDDLRIWDSDWGSAQLVSALSGRVQALIELERANEAGDVAEELEALAGKSAVTRTEVLRQLAALSAGLQIAEAWDATILALNATIRTASQSEHATDRGVIGLALIDKATVLVALGKDDEAAVVRRSAIEGFATEILAAVDEFVAETGASTVEEDVMRVAKALYTKADVVGAIGDHVGELTAVSELRELLGRTGNIASDIEIAARERWPDWFCD